MATESSIDQLKFFLKEMFQFNANDLDFGIYRIYNLKRKEIENFIDGTEEQCLESIINKTLELVSNIEKQVELSSLTAYLKKFNQENLVNDPAGNFDKIQQLILNFGTDDNEKEGLTTALTASTKEFNITDEIKDKIYNHILGFFEMYYSNGDFGYNNRSRSLYKVPYESDYDGNDTMFHWKHKGSLYIKTGGSFNAIKFKLKQIEKDFELRLETNSESSDEEVARNNNKDTKQKHYKFHRFEEIEGITRIIFNLSDSSTTKADLFKLIFKDVLNNKTELEKYLFAPDQKGDLKPVFNDLTDDYDKVQDGNVKGIGALRINRKTLHTKVNKNFEKGSKIELIIENGQECFSDETLEIMYNIDQKLNSFFIGNDSDYFIHENLQEFLSQEKERYIKNHILSDLKSILEGKLDNTTIIIARAFESVSSRIIEFLSSIEEFQKKLFTMKKKVVESEFCLTIDNIDEKFYKEILDNKTQIAEWENLFDVKVKNLADLKTQSTLVVDTKFFKQKDGSNSFKDKILSEIEDLDQKTNGLLINSENYQALNMLDQFNKKIDHIYIDPPYNTGSDGFLYKDSFINSSWVTFIENRIKMARELLTDKGSISCSIDDKSIDLLLQIFDKVFGYQNKVTVVIVKMSRATGVKMTHESKKSVRYKEYLVIYAKDKTKYEINPQYIKTSEIDDRYTKFIDNIEEDCKKWKISNISSKIKDIKKPEDILKFYKENHSKIIRLAANDQDVFKETKGQKYFQKIKTSTGLEKYAFSGQKVLFYSGKLKEIDGKLEFAENAGDLWVDIVDHINDLSNEGLVTLQNGKKPEFLLNRIIEMHTNNETDILLDFFSGSGTSSAVSLKNKRKFIGVESNFYFELITKRRITNTLFGEQRGISKVKNWKGGGIVKYIVLEQYEDTLDAIEQYDKAIPKNLPLKYLYKPELNKINSSLDLSQPFSNKIKYGQPTKEGFIDLLDTFNYFQGYEVKSIKPYTIGKKYYKVVETSDTLVIWRDIALGEDDSKAIKEIAEKYPEATQIEVNYDFNILATLKDKQLEVGKRMLGLNVIHADIFNQ
jgi:adenine-specific DNA-methyltransferase